jgi:serine/threonine protein kinase
MEDSMIGACSVMAAPSRFAGKAREATISMSAGYGGATPSVPSMASGYGADTPSMPSMGLGPRSSTPRMSFRMPLKSETAGSKNATPRIAFRGLAKSDTSGALETSFSRPSGGTSLVVEARPSTCPGKGLHAYLGGKDPLDVLSDLASEIDMTETSTIGRGHFGEVKRARRTKDGLNVAVKMIPLREVGVSVRREVQAMHDLEVHPNLIRLVDVYTSHSKQLLDAQCEGPYMCIVTEFIDDAEALARRIAGGGAQPSLASHVIPQLADALASIHQRGYVHRDVWSENILLKSSGSVVLVDFGASVRHDTGDIVTDRLNIPYAAPESSHRARQGTGEDCWAAGLVLSEIVTGQFLCDRIGTSTIPAYTKIRVMNEVKSETESIGGPVLGKLCADLLNFVAANRTAMKDVRSYFQPGSSITISSQNSKSRFERPVSQASTQEPSPATTPAPPMLPSHLTKAAQRTQTTAQSQGDGGSVKKTLPEQCISSTQARSAKIIKNDAGAGDGSVKEMAAFYITESAKKENISSNTEAADGRLEVGAKVNYIARSNGVTYPGVIEGRALAGKGWQVALHCGETKQVPDSDAWRISRIQYTKDSV